MLQFYDSLNDHAVAQCKTLQRRVLVSRFLLSASRAACIASLLTIPAHAAPIRGVGSTTATQAANPAAGVTPSLGGASPFTAGMSSASARALANRAVSASTLSAAIKLNADAHAAALNSITIFNHAIAVPNGLAAGGLVVASGLKDSKGNAAPRLAINDPSGLATWQGADIPLASAKDGTITVTIKQNDQRAVLSWDSFNIGRETTLQFQQQPNWVVLNRVVGQLDPSTGLRDPSRGATPSQIFGSIKAAGTVLVINANGILFGPTSQLNVHSLIATSFDVGYVTDKRTFNAPAGRNFVQSTTDANGNTTFNFTPSLTETVITGVDNQSFLQNGLPLKFFDPSAIPVLTSGGADLRLIPSYTSVLDTNSGPPDINSNPTPAKDPNGNVAYNITDVRYGSKNKAGLSNRVGDINVARGASITSDDSGSIILGAPHVINGGVLTAMNGAISLVAGNQLNIFAATGTNNDFLNTTGRVFAGFDSIQSNVRGLVVFAGQLQGGTLVFDSVPDSAVVNAVGGIISSTTGSVNLSSGGAVSNNGLLLSTTSEARNGSINIQSGKINLAAGSELAITPDIATIPDSSKSPAGTQSPTIPLASGATDFKNSVINLQSTYVNTSLALTGIEISGNGADAEGRQQLGSSIYAPGATVNINVANSAINAATNDSRILVGSGATIDVAGLKDVIIPKERNSIQIRPVKRNELRDTPLLRDVSTSGVFSLNGTTVYVDPRLSGVRADGVAWVGSPLIEAASYYAQVGVTVNELLTKGGTINITQGSLVASQSQPVKVQNADGSFTQGTATLKTDPRSTPDIIIQSGAKLDISGGWVNYEAGIVQTSRLVTTGGQIVDISQADPNTKYVGLVSGFIEHQDRWGIATSFANPLLLRGRLENAYTEGRDAGALRINAVNTSGQAVNSANTGSVALDGTVYADAFPGLNQKIKAQVGTAKSILSGDGRALQASTFQLPSGGLLSITSGVDIAVVKPADITDSVNSIGFGTATTVNVQGFTVNSNPLFNNIPIFNNDGSAATAPFLQKDFASALSDTRRNTTLLSDAFLNTSGFADVNLNAAGSVHIGAGTTAKDTAVNLQPGGVFSVTANNIQVDGTVFIPAGFISLALDKTTSIFTPVIKPVVPPVTKPIPVLDTPILALPSISINGTLSTRGRFVNDYNSTDGTLQGGAYTNGGSIALTAVTYQQFVNTVGGVDQSLPGAGSIDINTGALLDVSAGAYVKPSGVVDTNTVGGNVSLINQTAYFGPAGLGGGLGKTLVPPGMKAHVGIAAGSIKAFGFAGGGTFTLNTPLLNFAGNGPDDGTAISLDFIQKTGFGTLNITSYKSTILSNSADGDHSRGGYFATTDSNGNVAAVGGYNAVLDTQTLKVANGQTLNFSQSLYSPLLTLGQLTALQNLNTTTDAKSLGVGSVLTAVIPESAYDRRSANLALGGLVELDITKGGRIIGDAGAQLTVPKLLNEGSIRLIGGTITQNETLPQIYSITPNSQNIVGSLISTISNVNTALAIRSLGDVFTPNATDPNVYVLTDLTKIFALDSAGKKIQLLDPVTNLPSVDTLGNPVYQTRSNGNIAGNFDSARQQYSDGSNGNYYTKPVYFLGKLNASDGIILAAGSTTDLSGTSLINPRTVPASRSNLTPLADGKLVGGGSLKSLSAAASSPGYTVIYANTIVAAGATGANSAAIINISGASDSYDRLNINKIYGKTPFYSNAGSVSLANGGDINSASISAFGGDPKAGGGTFEVLNATLYQNTASLAAYTLKSGLTPQASSIVSADQLMRSGFDSLINNGSLTSAGDVSLTLGRSFILKSSRTSSLLAAGEHDLGASTSTAVSSTGSITLAAPYVRLSSADQNAQRIGTIGGVTSVFGSADGTGKQSITFNAGNIDVVGAVLFDRSVSKTNFNATGDLRLIGVVDPNPGAVPLPSLIGGLAVNGDLNITASQIYPTTGSTFSITSAGGIPVNPATVGGLPTLTTPGTITFARTSSTTPDTPYSAGGSLLVQADTINQGGIIRVPVGSLTLGSGIATTNAPATTNVNLLDSSITSVAAGGLNIPYGTTTDGIEYFFAPTTSAQLKATPRQIFTVAGTNVALNKGATVDVRGGGDVYAYEFTSGIGGSRDVLSRFNTDAFSANFVKGVGYQFADQRQVYAIVPSLKDTGVALYDPIYSVDYSELTSALGVGKRVYLDKSATLVAGWYTLLPAQYALLPGAVRIVENTGAAQVAPGSTVQLLDGSSIVTGYFGTAGTAFAESTRRTFTLENQSVFKQYSNIVTTSATKTFTALATRNGLIAPRTPNDAGKVIINPTVGLSIDTALLTSPGTDASGNKGRGAQVDITGQAFNIVSSLPAVLPMDGTITLTATSLTNLNAESLLIGGVRRDNTDGSTDIAITSSKIGLNNDASTPLSAPEVLLAVDAQAVDPFTLDPAATTAIQIPSAGITLGNGATVTATGTLLDKRTGPLNIFTTDQYYRDASGQFVAFGSFITLENKFGTERYRFDGKYSGVVPVNLNGFVANPLGNHDTGNGSVLRVANGVERLTLRKNPVPILAGPSPVDFNNNPLIVIPPVYTAATLGIGAATLSGTSVLLDTSGNSSIATKISVNAKNIAVGASQVNFAPNADPFATGLVVTPGLQSAFANANQITVRTAGLVNFTSGTYTFGNLVLDTPGFTTDTADSTVTLNTSKLTLASSNGALGACSAMLTICTTGTLNINAGELVLGGGTLRTYGFSNAVNVNASKGTFIEQAGNAFTDPATGTFQNGTGLLDFTTAAVALNTPFLGDRALAADPTRQVVIPTYKLATTGALIITKPAGSSNGDVNGVPGSSLTITAASVAVDGTRVRSTAGKLDITATTGALTTASGAVLETPGYNRSFGNGPDATLVSAAGGLLKLTALLGSATFNAGTTLSVGGGKGKAGTLSVAAPVGTVTLAGTLDGKAPDGLASFALDSGKAIDIASTLGLIGQQFNGDISIRTGAGDLTLAQGQTIKAANFGFTADGGAVDVAGIINTSGVNGGTINLYGSTGITLEATAKLDASAQGYGADAKRTAIGGDTRQAKGGNVVLGTDGSGALTILSGAVIDVSAKRSGDRLVPKAGNDAATGQPTTIYTLVNSDLGGKVNLRAPVIGAIGASQSINISYAGNIVGASDVSVEGFRRFDVGAIATDKRYVGVTSVLGGKEIVLDLTKAGKTTATGSTVNFLADSTFAYNSAGVLTKTDASKADTLVDFVQTFNLDGATGLGALITLTDSGGNSIYHSRPGMELDTSGTTSMHLVSNFNLGAGSVNIAAAVKAGDMRVSFFSPDYAAPKFDSKTLYEVVAGKDADLFANYTTLTYRTGGKLVNATGTRSASGNTVFGDAGVLTVRAGGNLLIGTHYEDGSKPDVTASITDGFFQFRDQANPDYLSYQLGGGKRQYTPFINTYCNDGASGYYCGGVGDFTQSLTDPNTGKPLARLDARSTNYLVVDLSNIYTLYSPALRGNDPTNGGGSVTDGAQGRNVYVDSRTGAYIPVNIDTKGNPTQDYYDDSAQKSIPFSISSNAPGASGANLVATHLALTVDPSTGLPFVDPNSTTGAFAFTSTNTVSKGDALASAQLFPLLADNKALGSTSYQLVGGAQITSANPILTKQMDSAQAAFTGNVIVAGERVYSYSATAPVVGFSDNLSFQFQTIAGVDVFGSPATRINKDSNLGNIIYTAGVGINTNTTSNSGGAGLAFTSDNTQNWLQDTSTTVNNTGNAGLAYTNINFKNAPTLAKTFLQSQIKSFVKGLARSDYQYFDATNKVVYSIAQAASVSLTINNAQLFLSGISKSFTSKLAATGFANDKNKADKKVYTDAVPRSPYTQSASVKTLIRSGTGSISIAASGNVDTQNGKVVTFRDQRGVDLKQNPATSVDTIYANGFYNALQTGGAAIYTAGHLINVLQATAQLDASHFAINENIITTRDYGYSYAASIGIGNNSVYNGFAHNTINSTSASLGPVYSTPSINTVLADPVYLGGGGDVTLLAGADILGRRDARTEVNSINIPGLTGAANQPWRIGQVSANTQIRINPQQFQEGIGALGGGNIMLKAGGNVADLTIVSDTSITTGNTVGQVASSTVQWSNGGGNVGVNAGGSLLGGRVDVASGTSQIKAIGGVTSAALTTTPIIDGVAIDASSAPILNPNAFDSKGNNLPYNVYIGNSTPTGSTNLLRLRLSDATVSIDSGRSVTLQGIAALGVNAPEAGIDATGLVINKAGFYTPVAGVSVLANETVTLANVNTSVALNDVLVAYSSSTAAAVLPGSFAAKSLLGDVSLAVGANVLEATNITLVPASTGELSLIAGDNVTQTTINVSDRNFNLTPVYRLSTAANPSGSDLYIANATELFGFPDLTPAETDAYRRSLHNQNPTHAGDTTPIQLFAGIDITNVTLNVPKLARIGAGRDITNMVFFGQNLGKEDVTQITAGRDISATTILATVGASTLPVTQGNNFMLGGPGALFLEAGRDAGPFLNSANIVSGGTTQSFGGGVITNGNEFNPWLQMSGAKLYTAFGVAGGTDYTTLRDTYVNPVNVANLDGALFGQTADTFGNVSADRTKPIYATKLLQWMTDHGYGTNGATVDQAYSAFIALPELIQHQFLLDVVYFNELKQTSIPTVIDELTGKAIANPSYLKYARGYKAVNSLFPAAYGYTQNSSSGGLASGTQLVQSGNLDLRLSTLQTSRGGDLTILGPGGNILGGSVVRTSDQAARRGYAGASGGGGGLAGLFNGIHFDGVSPAFAIASIPTGYEGVLTLRGGNINSFTDGNFVLNQSRLFTEGGGEPGYGHDINLWSSNGDLNAGQGPKTSFNIPPVVLKFDPNGYSEVDAAGNVSGAGIASFPYSEALRNQLNALGMPYDNPNVFLIAPRGTVDAGDAGVRVAGSLFVAAARVANADNFKVSFASFGLPTAAPVVAPPQSANSAVSDAEKLNDIASAAGGSRAKSRVIVDVLGYASDYCDETTDKRPADCPAPKAKGGEGKKAGNK